MTTPEQTPEQRLEAVIAKNKELLEELAGLKGLKKSIDELGGIEGIRTVVESSEELKNKIAEASSNVETVRSQLTAKLNEKEQKLQEFKNRVLDKRVEDQLQSKVKEAGGVWDLLDTKVKSRVKYEYNEETDELKLQVLDATGKPALRDGNPLGVEDLITEFKNNEVFSRAFEVNKERTGTGIQPGKVATSSLPNNPFLTDDVDAQTALFRKDPVLGKRLQQEARARARA